MMFTIEFFRIRERDNAHATLARVTHIASDLESAKVKARSLFDIGTLNMPQNPDGLRILDQDGNEVFFWTPGVSDPSGMKRAKRFNKCSSVIFRLTSNVYARTSPRHIVRSFFPCDQYIYIS